ncbi:MAG: DNA repair protein RadC [Anaeroplasmataceae bacterium]|nr:DNA repair protein RadC [Anaeroplasmataceae bacterium]
MIENLQKKDRPRERLIEKGAASLSDVELLAVLLGSGTQKRDVLSLAAYILNQYSLYELKDLSYERLADLDGIKQAKACLLLACFELAKRAMNASLKNVCLDTPKSIYDLVYGDIYLEHTEVIIILYVNCKLKLIKKKIFSSENSSSVFLSNKQILKEAMDLHAYGIILIHNHPSGDVRPSEADLEATFELKKLLSQIEVCLLDHLVVSAQGFYSFLESGLLSEGREYNKTGDFDEEDFNQMFSFSDPRF